MTNHAPDTENVPASPDGIDRLEEMQQRMKEQQEAWRKLLESLGGMKKEQNDPPTTDKPTS